jgi:serine/threonine protein phosphatase PrpC
MKISTISIRGSGEWNEDALIVRERDGLFGVVDGATSLVPFRTPAGETGGVLAARITAETVMGMALGEDAGAAALADMLAEANRRLAERMAAFGIDPSRKEALWSAGALLVRVRPDAVDFAQAGDCMLVAGYRDGSYRVLTRDQLAAADRATLRKWAEAVASGIRERERLWQAVLPVIEAGRRKANAAHPEGYALLNGDPAFARHIESGTINRLGLSSLLLMTDGLYVPKADPAEAFDAAETARLVGRMGLEAYAEWLAELERSDAACVKYPRVKPSDDKTAVLLKFPDGTPQAVPARNTQIT